MRSLGLPCKTSCVFFFFKKKKKKNTAGHGVNSVLKGFRNYYLPLVENLVKTLPKSPNKWKFNQ